jgi:hypothetical protein
MLFGNLILKKIFDFVFSISTYQWIFGFSFLIFLGIKSSISNLFKHLQKINRLERVFWPILKFLKNMVVFLLILTIIEIIEEFECMEYICDQIILVTKFHNLNMYLKNKVHDGIFGWIFCWCMILIYINFDSKFNFEFQNVVLQILKFFAYV